MDIQKIKKFLDSKGCNCILQDDQSMAFEITKKNSSNLIDDFEIEAGESSIHALLMVSNNDDKFLGVYFPNFFEITNTLQKKKALKYIHKFNIEYNGIKFMFNKRGKNNFTVGSSVEIFMSSFSQFTKLYKHMLSCLLHTTVTFHNQLLDELGED